MRSQSGTGERAASQAQTSVAPEDRAPVDVLVIGGGINGVGIARDAAGRGLSVLLCEQYDLASGTSSASTKLIHGGLRYLEHLEFRLVRESLAEREVLLNVAPHIVWPLRFVLPHHRGLRPASVLRFGLFVYDHLGGNRRLPGARRLHLQHHPAGAPLKPMFTYGFEYSDCWVDDARLVVLNAVDAEERGATILTRTAVAGARRNGRVWEVDIRASGSRPRTVRARALVNAAGPWVADVIESLGGHPPLDRLRLVKGSHIVVPRLYDGDHAYCFQGSDGRVVFAIPYEGHYSLIGTTEVSFAGQPESTGVSFEERSYLCEAVSRYFEQLVVPEDAVWEYSGVRPLYDDEAGQSADPGTLTRDYVLELDSPAGTPPLLNVFGGKITTYRRLAERALALLGPALGRQAGEWTQAAALPGGDIPNADFPSFSVATAARWPWLPRPLLHRLLRAYGTRAERIVGDAGSVAELGRDFGGGLHEAEVEYLVNVEWARSAEDVLWRRSKLGLHLPASGQRALESWLSGSGAG